MDCGHQLVDRRAAVITSDRGVQVQADALDRIQLGAVRRQEVRSRKRGRLAKANCVCRLEWML